MENHSIHESKLNFFDIFELDHSYNIDLKKLELKYLELMKSFHPDNFFDSNKKKKAINLTKIINNAYKVLGNKRLVREYLLSKKGVFVNSSNDNVKPNVELLNRIFFYRESLEEFIHLSDFLKMENQVTTDLKNAYIEFDEFFDKNEYLDAGHKLLEIRYIEKVIEELKHKKEAK